MNAGTLQRARKTPHTITKDTVIGEICGFTSLMGASAPPSQAPAANPQKIPNACSDRKRAAGTMLETSGGVACTFAGKEFNGVCPEGRTRPAERLGESRSGRRLRWPESDCGVGQRSCWDAMLWTNVEGVNARGGCGGSRRKDGRTDETFQNVAPGNSKFRSRQPEKTPRLLTGRLCTGTSGI